MKTKMTLKLAALASVVAVALFAGCKKQETHSEHDGHDHSSHAQPKTNAPAQDDHTGHNHGPGEHPTPPANK